MTCVLCQTQAHRDSHGAIVVDARPVRHPVDGVDGADGGEVAAVQAGQQLGQAQPARSRRALAILLPWGGGRGSAPTGVLGSKTGHFGGGWVTLGERGDPGDPKAPSDRSRGGEHFFPGVLITKRKKGSRKWTFSVFYRPLKIF